MTSRTKDENKPAGICPECKGKNVVVRAGQYNRKTGKPIRPLMGYLLAGIFLLPLAAILIAMIYAWIAGNPPQPLPVYKPPRIDWMNGMKNACFEFGTLEAWTRTDSAAARLVKGNGWGTGWAMGTKDKKKHRTGTSKFELQLGPGKDGVSQVVTGLSPNRKYTLSAWVRVSDKNQIVVLGVKDFGGQGVAVESSPTEWERKSVTFTTGSGVNKATVYLLKKTAGKGNAWGDNFVLPLVPGNR